jgi:hypothetical protein
MTIEIQVCEFIDRAPTGMQSPATYHVEVRFIPKPGMHSICFRGEIFRDRATAEAEKTYVESVFSRAVLKKPKPLKERTRTKTRKRSGRA